MKHFECFSKKCLIACSSEAVQNMRWTRSFIMNFATSATTIIKVYPEKAAYYDLVIVENYLADIPVNDKSILNEIKKTLLPVNRQSSCVRHP